MKQIKMYESGHKMLMAWFAKVTEINCEWLHYPDVVDCGDRFINISDIYEIAKAYDKGSISAEDVYKTFTDWYDFNLVTADCGVIGCNINSWLMGYNKTLDYHNKVQSCKKIYELREELEKEVSKYENQD